MKATLTTMKWPGLIAIFLALIVCASDYLTLARRMDYQIQSVSYNLRQVPKFHSQFVDSLALADSQTWGMRVPTGTSLPSTTSTGVPSLASINCSAEGSRLIIKKGAVERHWVLHGVVGREGELSALFHVLKDEVAWRRVGLDQSLDDGIFVAALKPLSTDVACLAEDGQYQIVTLTLFRGQSTVEN